MPQSQTAASSVNRVTRWRYQSAVQAARTLNAIGGFSMARPRPRHASDERARTVTGASSTAERALIGPR
ncbi:MAG TPA: hypothetical protein VFT70_06570 [Nocardioides sp.]|nr:hypothetical protein [Nocardioides sp.]